ncbi:MAG TPA: xylulokinase [Ktedonobacterales bacterium]
MSQSTLLLGLDVSTTGVKALLVNERGGVVASASVPHVSFAPRPLWSEQRPEDWWDGAVTAIRAALAEAGAQGSAVRAVGLTGQMHGMVALDEAGAVLRPAILWNDQRTAAECDEIRARVGRERLIALTGNDALTGFTAPKILWTRRHEPQVYANTRHILLPKDYLRLRLTGEYAMDKADGSGTLLFDLARRDWSGEVLGALELPAGWFPPTFEGPEITGAVTAEAATLTGLEAGVPVVAGGGDQAAQAVGVGAVTPGVLAITLGTSGAIFATTDRPVIEPAGRLHAFCHAVPGRWHLMGVMLSAAGSLQWLRDTLAPGESFAGLVSEAATAPAGSDGLLFLPYLNGERTPYPDPLARAAWVGLTARHTRAHLTRAVLEGVSFGLRDMLGLMREAGLPVPDRARVSGGGARGPLWRAIIASTLRLSLDLPASTEGAAYGAALLAGVGAGVWHDTDAAAATIAITPGAESDPTDAARYDELYERYRALYATLAPTFHDLARFEGGDAVERT